MRIKQMKTMSFARFLVAVSALCFATIAFAIEPVYTSFFSNKAAGGYDVVNYFKNNKPVEGNAKFSTEYEG
jgi:hypothetical protein